MQELIETIDNGSSEVQIATIGTVIGSDIEGNAIRQEFTPEALKKIADDSKGKEYLVDKDHESEKGGSTEAAGWISELEFKENKGLFGKINWTSVGRKLVENRIFRFLSPTWLLDKFNRPEEMTSVALTNKPAQAGRIQPIINSEPISNGKDISQMNIEELKALIRETLAEIKAESEAEEAKEEMKEEPAKVEEAKDTVENATCCPIVEVIKEEPAKAEEPVKAEEVIKEAALNSAPTTIGISIEKEPEWKKLTGKAFRDYIESGKYRNA